MVTKVRAIESQVYRVTGPRALEVASQTLVLEGLGVQEVAVETLYTAVSPGTEMAAYRGMTPLRPDRRHSRIVGYCNLGRILAVGDWVRQYAPGDLILTMESHRSHFICDATDIVTVLPDGPDGSWSPPFLQEAATTYLFHQGYNALLRGELKPGQNVAVLGLGTLGLATVALATRFGASVYGVTDQSASSALAMQFGALAVFDKADGRVDSGLKTETNGTGIDLLVTTSSRWADWQLAARLTRSGGTICVLGFPGRFENPPDFNPLDPRWFYRKQVTVRACGYTPDVDIDPHDIRFTTSRNCAYLVDMILRRRLPAGTLISAVTPWSELESVYRRIESREDDFYTAVLRWAGEEP